VIARPIVTMVILASLASGSGGHDRPVLHGLPAV
jgi:hypothetical protein